MHFWILDYFLKYSILNETRRKINTLFKRKGCVTIKIETFSINPLLKKWILHVTKFKFGLKGTKMMLRTSWVDLAQKNFWVAWRCRMKLFYTILSVTLVAWSMLVRKTIVFCFGCCFNALWKIKLFGLKLHIS